MSSESVAKGGTSEAAPSLLAGKRLGVIGVGKIGEAVLSGLFAAKMLRPEDVTGSVRSPHSLERVRRSLGIAMTQSNAEAAAGRDVILLAVKPQIMPSVLADLRLVIHDKTLVISVVASVTTARIEAGLQHLCPVIRAMPNTPCLVRSGMSVLAAGAHVKAEHIALGRELFGACGETAVLGEELLDAVTGLSGSGPAYIYLVIESLAEAGVKVGIPRDVSTLLSAQTVFGAAKMVLESRAHPALLRDSVTTPAGCTVDGLLELEEGKLRVTLIKAVVKAAERAAQLSPPE